LKDEVAFDLDHEPKEIFRTVSVIHQDDEIGPIMPAFAAQQVWDLEVQAVVLHVRLHLRVLFRDAAELRLPIAVGNHPVHVALRGVGLPTVGLRGVEADVAATAGRVVRVEQCLDRPFVEKMLRDAVRNFLARPVAEVAVEDLCLERITLANEVVIEPLLDDSLQLAEEVQFRLLSGIAELGVQ
jgi:hypothetical protein